MRLRINFIFRKRLPHYNSIEELFGSIQKQLESRAVIRSIELPHSGASLRSLIKNMTYIKVMPEEFYHITGDVNYMGIIFGKQAILTVHDIQSVLKGNWLKRRLKKWIWFQWPARRVRFVTVISDFSKRELSELIPKHKDKIKVIYNPVNSTIVEDPDHQFNTVEPHILLMGTKPNKNLERSIEALSGLKCKLVIVGQLTSRQKNLLIQHQLYYENHFNLTFQEIVKLYQTCDLLCFPSTYEGFGMPIIEAQAIGRPIITSNLGAMKEVAGKGACLVNPHEVDDIKEKVQKVVNDQKYRMELIERGFENVKRFDLKYISSQYLVLYKELEN